MHAIARVLTSRLWAAVIAVIAVLGSGLVIGALPAMMPCPPTDTRTAPTRAPRYSSSGAANFRLLGTTALVVAILLIVTYRSPVLWLIPLTIVGLADQVASSAATHRHGGSARSAGLLRAVGVLAEDPEVG